MEYHVYRRKALKIGGEVCCEGGYEAVFAKKCVSAAVT